MDLNDLRKKIDAIDDQIIDLLQERTKHVMGIGEAKNQEGKVAYAPEREMQIYEKLSATKGSGPMPVDGLKAIYREIMSASISLERPSKVAYLGPEATYTHLSSISKFGSSVEYVPMDNIPDVFEEVSQKRADYGVIPVENSIEGGVTHSLDMFIDSNLKICSEIFFKISHNLMSNSDMKHIKKIYSNPQVFGQCRHWLRNNLPKVELIDTASTANAACRAQSEDGSAAIGSSLAATIYNLPVLAESIQDFSGNVTRFLVISRDIPKPTKKDKTSIILSLSDKVGALYEMLKPIQQAGINMAKIESRPSKKKAWDYYFFIDLEGHIEDPVIKEAVDKMEENVKFLKVLGSYPSVEFD